ncbi:MAG TPA: PQQ-dependent sugar dehydrogenase, partial [Steroidobacteraceae bacterium]|nr:PQQ-dependent sugar dehydrogenase [Steroidobacteraceae bacterium]
TANPVGSGVLQSRISRFTMSGGVIDPASESILLTIAQPFTNHNGGNIVFGPDGYLYAGFGDGGSGGDPNNNAQNRSTLLGKLLRIDVRGDGAYTIPPDNPYVGAGTARCETGTSGSSAMCQEIYAYGFRNPWRFSFDAGAPTDLWLADVGQNAWEEVDRVQRGGNYGWRFREGAHCFNPSTNCPTTANGAPLIDPVAEYGHDLGSSVTGGYVYRGSAIPGLVGRYVFGDFGSGRIFTLIPNSGGTLDRVQLLQTSLSISTFAQASDGELYVVDYAGKLFKLVPASASGPSPIKTQLSQTGCFSSTNPTQPVAGLIPYAPNAAFWSDGATKQRWMGVPDGQRITVDPSTGDFDFPNGTVLVKNFSLNGQLVETRLFMRHTDTGNWGGYTYRWNDAHTDATLVSGGLVANVAGQDWIWPSEAQCLQCHTAAAGGSLGLEVQQLNSDFAYPTGRTANQLDTLEAIGMFTSSPVRLPAMPNPADATKPLADRARAYLHTNCSNCHRPGGGTPVTLDLRYTTPIADTNTCNVDPVQGDLGVAGAKVIAPGDAAHSLLYLRMNRRDSNQMPPIASNRVDTDGAMLLQQWISAMNTSCQ